MMLKLSQYSCVRIEKLIDATRDFDGWQINQRPPHIGDIGTIVDILKAKNLPDIYVVESSETSNGTTIWLSQFLAEELELVELA